MKCKNCGQEEINGTSPLCCSCWDEWMELDQHIKEYEKTKRDPTEIVLNKD